MLLWIFSKSFTVFVFSRIVGGLTEGNVQMSIAMISDVTTTETRSRGLVRELRSSPSSFRANDYSFLMVLAI